MSLLKYLRDCSSTNSKYISTREFYFIRLMIQFASLYLSILLDIVIMQDIVFSIILNTPKLYLLSSNEFIWDHLWTDSVKIGNAISNRTYYMIYIMLPKTLAQFNCESLLFSLFWNAKLTFIGHLTIWTFNIWTS